jgi:hypothetical protein
VKTIRLRFTLYIILFLCLTFHQNYGQKGVSVGINLIIQHTGFTLGTDYNPFRKITIRPAFGLIIDYHFNDLIGIQSGLAFHFYTQKGENFVNNFAYFTIPVLLKINGKIDLNNELDVKKLKPAFLLGLNNHFLLKAQHVSGGEKQNLIEYSEKYHFELVGGPGVKVRINEHLMFENFLFYSFGNPVNKYEYHSIGHIITSNLGVSFLLTYHLLQ